MRTKNRFSLVVLCYFVTLSGRQERRSSPLMTVNGVLGVKGRRHLHLPNKEVEVGEWVHDFIPLSTIQSWENHQIAYLSRDDEEAIEREIRVHGHQHLGDSLEKWGHAKWLDDYQQKKIGEGLNYTHTEYKQTYRVKVGAYEEKKLVEWDTKSDLDSM